MSRTSLEARGAPPPCPSRGSHASRWTRYNIHEILCNPMYIGDFYDNRRYFGKYNRVKGGRLK
jgi:hypothetical protein